MKITRWKPFDANANYPTQETMRVLTATCPLCRKSVQFSLMDDEFTIQENEYLQKRLEWALKEVERLNLLIDKLIRE